ncbi:MAG: MFS transporter, partial [Acetobacteraceae bacterium]
MQKQAAAGAPDSLTGWFAALAAFIAGFVVFGVMYSFGVFFTPMHTEVHATSTATSVFFVVTGMLFYFSGYVTGRLSDRFGPRPIVGAGAFIMGAGLLLTASAGQMWAGYLAYGIGVGIGAGCAYIPTLAVVGGWFTRHRNTALGLAAAGTGCGTLLMPPVAALLIQAHGWRAVYTMFGVGSFVLLLVCAWLVAPPPLARRGAGQKLRRIITTRPFVLLYASWVLATTGLSASWVFLAPSARALGAGPLAASALVSLIGGLSVLGRAGSGFVSERLGSLRLFKLSVFLMAVSYVLWLPFTAYA